MATVLIVDDEIEMCNILQMLLSFKGYDCELAHTGAGALEIIRRHRIDIVLLDIMMPGMNGFEVCRTIKNDRDLQSIPVIMVTALAEKKDRIKGIEAGADDFISKPINHGEVLARIKMLLKLKQANDVLNHAFEDIQNLIVYGEETFNSYSSEEFDFISKIDGIVDRIIRKKSDMTHQPESVVVGYANERGLWSWQYYESVFQRLTRSALDGDIHQSLEPLLKEESQIGFLNEGEVKKPEFGFFIKVLHSRNLQIRNLVYYLSKGLCIFTLNHGREVGRYDAAILYSMVTLSDSLRSLAIQVRETEDAFQYAVHALARGAEVNDEDTGKHILRVGEYAAFIAEELDLPATVVKAIRQQATLHDVGKLYIPSTILKKAGKFNDSEMEIVKQHPLYGARIIGDHPRFQIGRNIALTHHERWDGSGYPRGLCGEEIPIEGRIAALADQYDALRNRRVYKDAFDHSKVVDILTRGDGRTMPSHFDPRVLDVFSRFDGKFADIYERMKD